MANGSSSSSFQAAVRIAAVLSTVMIGTADAAAGAAAHPQAPAYRVSRTIPLGAPDRWDYVTFDLGSHRVFVAHGVRVTVVDGRSGVVLGAVTGIPGGTHGIGISTKTGQGFTDDGEAGVAVPFDLATLKPKPPIETGADADGIVVDPASGQVFVVDGEPGTLSVIDPTKDRKIATIDGGGKLEFAVADGRGHVFVDGEAKHEIVRIDTRRNRVDAHWPMPGCRSPHGLAIDVATNRLFAGCANKTLTEINAETGAVVANLPIGAGNDGVVFDPKRRRVLAANGVDGTLSVFTERADGTIAPFETLTTAKSARTLAIDPDTGRVFLVAADLGPVPSGGRRPQARPGSVRLIFLDANDETKTR